MSNSNKRDSGRDTRNSSNGNSRSGFNNKRDSGGRDNQGGGRNNRRPRLSDPLIMHLPNHPPPPVMASSDPWGSNNIQPPVDLPNPVPGQMPAVQQLASTIQTVAALAASQQQPPQQGYPGYNNFNSGNFPPQGFPNQPPQQGGYPNQPPQQGYPNQPPQQQQGGYPSNQGSYNNPLPTARGGGGDWGRGGMEQEAPGGAQMLRDFRATRETFSSNEGWT